KILVGLDGLDGIERLNPDGSSDPSFSGIANNTVLGLTTQTDGLILIGGAFNSLDSGPRNFIGRLIADGSLDDPYDPGANAEVIALTIQGDGKTIATGLFLTLGGGGTGTAARSGIGRLTNTSAALQNLSVTGVGSTITWERGDTSPEIQQATFELSLDGTTFNPLTEPTRIPGGWQLGGQSLPLLQSIF